MGLRFRKSINIGPLRINFSKSGIGFSLGVKGFRVSRSAKGKNTANVQDLDKDSLEDAVGDVKEVIENVVDIFDGDDDKKK